MRRNGKNRVFYEETNATQRETRQRQKTLMEKKTSQRATPRTDLSRLPAENTLDCVPDRFHLQKRWQRPVNIHDESSGHRAVSIGDVDRADRCSRFCFP